MQKQQAIATWNPDKDYWETPQTDIFGHSVAYSETLPKSGMTRNGQLFELATSGERTTAPESSLLPTPVAQPSGNSPEEHLRKKPGRKQVTDLSIIVENGLLETGGRLLPTPKASDGVMGRPRTSGRPIEKSTFLGTIVTLLPTPKSNDWRDNNSPSENNRHSPALTAVDTYFLTPTASDSTGGGQHPAKRRGHTQQLIDTVLGLSGDNTPPLFDVGKS